MHARLARVFLLAVCLAAIAGALSGCATTDPENESVRPWNTPKQWENGLPGGMMQGR
jgi:type IV pilus biogenesis protein CpaD/CtpE